MLIALIAGIVTFILTIIGIPPFSFTIRLVSQANRCTKMLSSIRPRPERQLWWYCLSFDICFGQLCYRSVFASAVKRPHLFFFLGPVWRCRLLDDFLKVFRKINEGLNPSRNCFCSWSAELSFTSFTISTVQVIN